MTSNNGKYIQHELVLDDSLAVSPFVTVATAAAAAGIYDIMVRSHTMGLGRIMIYDPDVYNVWDIQYPPQ